jgi:hypothetical protein
MGQVHSPCPISAEILIQSIMCLWKDQPKQQVESQAWHTSRDQGDQESQPEPEGTDSEELSQAAAHSGYHMIMVRAVQGIRLGGCIHAIFSVSRVA